MIPEPYKILESWNVEKPNKVENNNDTFIGTFSMLYDINTIQKNISYTINDSVLNLIGKEFLEQLYKDYFYIHFYEWINL